MHFSFTEPTISTSLYEHTAVRQQANERTSVCVCVFCQYSKWCIDNTEFFVALKHDTLPRFLEGAKGSSVIQGK